MKLTLKAARVNKSLSQAEAAKALGINGTTLSRWEAGKTYPTTKHIPNIEKLYEINYNNIIFLR